MFGGNNNNPAFPVILGENQFQYDSNASTQLQLFGNFSAGINGDPANYIQNDHASAMNWLSKRNQDVEDVSRQQKLQISLNNFSQEETDFSAGIPHTNAVSTGLRLSYDDDERNSSITSASGSVSALPLFVSLDNNLRIELDRQREEFDHYIRVQEEHIAKGIKEMKQRHLASFLSAIEKGVNRKLREKELEIENMNRKNKELLEKIKQVAVEAQSWHYRARYNESVVNVLKNNLKQVIAQGADQCKEGCGDSEVDDAASSYNPNIFLRDIAPKPLPGNKSLNEQMVCKACKGREISMLLLPCRHLCLCKDCEGLIDVCPVCRSVKTASVQVYMS